MKIAYVRDMETRQPYGCIVKTDSGYGYSVCNPHDSFQKARAREIAIGRAEKRGFTQDEVIRHVPSDLKDAFANVFDIAFSESNETEYSGKFLGVPCLDKYEPVKTEVQTVKSGFFSRVVSKLFN